MSRFYFGLLNGSGLTRDEEGADLPDLAAARQRAIREARCIMAHEVRRGQLDLSGRVVVRTDAGEILLEIQFDEALRIAHPGG